MAKRRKKAHQHYVPRFVLRKFANEGDSVLRYNRITGGTDLVSTRHAAVIKDGYTFWRDRERNEAFEDLLAVVEGDAAPHFRTLAEGHEMAPAAREAVGRFLAYQRVRVPSWRRSLEHTYEYMSALPGFIEQHPFPDRGEQFAYAVELAEDEIRPRLLAMSWYTIIASRPAFVLGDNPVVLFREAAQFDEGLAIGLDACDEISFPVSPHVLLLLDAENRAAEHCVVDTRPDPRVQLVITGPSDPLAALVREKDRLAGKLLGNMQDRNRLALMRSHRYVFCVPEAASLLDDFVALGNPTHMSFEGGDGVQNDRQRRFSGAPHRVDPLRNSQAIEDYLEHLDETDPRGL